MAQGPPQAPARIYAGRMPELGRPEAGLTDFYFVDAAEPELAASRVVELVQHRIPSRFGLDPRQDVQAPKACSGPPR